MIDGLLKIEPTQLETAPEGKEWISGKELISRLRAVGSVSRLRPESCAHMTPLTLLFPVARPTAERKSVKRLVLATQLASPFARLRQ